jgi:hypothetical protein
MGLVKRWLIEKGGGRPRPTQHEGPSVLLVRCPRRPTSGLENWQDAEEMATAG